MDDEEKRPTAIKELEILSSIIARIESTIYQKQGWLLTLITGLALALLKDNPLISKQQFAAISAFITIVFYITDIVQRVPVHRAIKRSTNVESYLQGNQTSYDGPKISEALGQGEGIRDFFSFFWKVRVCGRYVGTMFMIFIIYGFAP